MQYLFFCFQVPSLKRQGEQKVKKLVQLRRLNPVKLCAYIIIAQEYKTNAATFHPLMHNAIFTTIFTICVDNFFFNNHILNFCSPSRVSQ